MALVSAMIVLTGCATAILLAKQSFDTDVLNLLPADNPAVQGLKFGNENFVQNREISFVFSHADPDVLEEFHAAFVEALAREPWVIRLLDGAPIETATGREDLVRITAPLLLNLPPDEFAAAMERLAPDEIRSRIARLAGRAAGGSPAAAIELRTDPLGLLADAAAPLHESSVLEGTMDLVSSDGTTRVLPVIVDQPTLGAADCVATMQRVGEFIENQRFGFGSDVPRIGVTGRSAYVAEISASMRRDIMLTSSISLFAVVALFWAAFRKVLPLVGIALLLALSSLVALALGNLVFHQINVIAIGFCSILFGLGDDFGLLLYEGYRHARSGNLPHERAVSRSIREMTPGIFWVAATTSIGFLALAFGGSGGFAQLGGMVAIGVFVCAALVTIFLFVFIRRTVHPAGDSTPAFHITNPLLARPGIIALPAASVLLGLAVIALMPFRPLEFDTSPQSLEPTDIPAAQALATIMKAFPDSFEPVMVVQPGADSTSSAHDRSMQLDQHLESLVQSGMVAGFASPTAMILNETRVSENRDRIPDALSEQAAQAFREALTAQGLNPEAFAGTFAVIKALAAGSPSARWTDVLDPESPWWFVIDRMIAPDSLSTITFVRPMPEFTTPEASNLLGHAINEGVPDALVTGWSLMLGSLVPWAKQELVFYGSAVAGSILLVLAFVYRDFRLWVLHAAGLALALAATVATLKLAAVQINLLNVLAFPLMLAVGVDYGIHLLLAIRRGVEHVPGVLKPVLISGLSTAAGFGALTLASNPALSGLGRVCATGVLWSLAAAMCFILPAAVLWRKRPEPVGRTRRSR